MPVSIALKDLLGLRDGAPNNADTSNSASVEIARRMTTAIHPLDHDGPVNPGADMPRVLADQLAMDLQAVDGSSDWRCNRAAVAEFAQYRHLGELQELAGRHQVLRSQFGGSLSIRPDVTVSTVGTGSLRVMHAAIFTMWTIRSDRVQGLRNDATAMIRYRRGRLPHIVAVTAEPLASRLASIARGTGEIDQVYHIALTQLRRATDQCGSDEQCAILEELIDQRRLRPVEELAEVLALT